MVMRKIMWDPEPDLVLTTTTQAIAVEVQPVQVVEEPADLVVTQQVAMVPGPGIGRNGHRVAKIRELFTTEKDKIRDGLFLTYNGMIGPDLCVIFRARELPEEVSIFQVTGYVTALHGQVARGALRVGDMERYEDYIRSRRTLWARYNSPKYQALRNRLDQAIDEAMARREPQFEAVPVTRRR